MWAALRKNEQWLYPTILAILGLAAGASLTILVKKAISTNLISTKNFSGMAPIKIGVTTHCRAYKNVDLEVRQPSNELMQWALPEQLAPDGPVDDALAGHLCRVPVKGAANLA